MPSFSGLWNNEFGENHSLLSDTVAIGNNRSRVARGLSRAIYGSAALREIMVTLTGAAAGSAAFASHKRVQAERDLEANVQGGVRTIETFEAIDRNTTAGDVTDVTAMLELQHKPSSYPVDKAGNGGGGKLGW